jgi:sugar lactone lactonase YvrE
VTRVTTSVLLDGLAFPEGPRWHDGRLWFSDQHTGLVTAVSPDGDVETIAEVPGGPSGLGWLPDGRLLVVSMLGRRLLGREGDGTLVEVADLSGHVSSECNDMVVDRVGRAYVGNFGFDFRAHEPFAPTLLLRVDPDGSASVAAEDLAFPNGTVITPDGATLIVGESYGRRFTAFRVGDDGTLHDRRVWAALDGATPDGCCLDAEGAIWFADPMGRRVLRVREGGEIVDEVRVSGGNNAYACMLGGEARRTLFVCTAPSSNPAKTMPARAGRIEAIDVEVPGAGLP